MHRLPTWFPNVVRLRTRNHVALTLICRNTRVIPPKRGT